jgi:hypothetical protein
MEKTLVFKFIWGSVLRVSPRLGNPIDAVIKTSLNDFTDWGPIYGSVEGWTKIDNQ